MVFWVICLWVQGSTAQTLKGKHPAIISTTSLNSNLSFLQQMRPLEEMDSYLIVLPRLYFSAFTDGSVKSVVELPPLLYFDLRSTLNSSPCCTSLSWLISLPPRQCFSLWGLYKCMSHWWRLILSFRDCGQLKGLKVSWVMCIYRRTFFLSVLTGSGLIITESKVHNLLETSLCIDYSCCFRSLSDLV